MLKQPVHEERAIAGKVPPKPVDPTDSELLMQFVRHKAHDAFEQLVSRHAGMVLGVCRQILHDRHDAEDAFQATFLILAQRADKIQRTGSVGAWLHQVAYRMAMRAAKRRQLRRAQVLEDAESASAEPWLRITQQEQQHALHEELSRLPEQYRGPLVLCYLEGKTRGEAAEELETTEDSVKHRLARGKRMLRIRLARRGIMVSAAFTVAATSTTTCQATSLSSLVALTTETCAAAALQGSTTVFSTTIGSLAREGAEAMKLSVHYRAAAAAAAAAAAVIVTGAVGTFSLLDEVLATERSAASSNVVAVHFAVEEELQQELTGLQFTIDPAGELALPPVTESLVGADLTEEQQRLADSRETWEEAKTECGGNYAYSVRFYNIDGFGGQTVVVVRNDDVVERRFIEADAARRFTPGGPFGPPSGELDQFGYPPLSDGTWKWTETGDEVGSHDDRAAPPKTLDELYDEAEAVAALELEPHQRRYIRFDDRGLLRSCFWVDTRIADDAPTNGVKISSIALGDSD